MVVQPPTHVLGVGLTPVAPPGVGLLGGGGLQLPVHVHQAGLVQQLRHPGPFLGQEAGVFTVAFPILQVNFLVRYVDVATQDELTLGLEADQMRVKLGQKPEFGLLAILARRATGKITTDDGALGRWGVKPQLHITALHIKLG